MATLDTVLAATLNKSRKKLIVASVKSTALQAWVFANNRVEFEDGGYHITNPLTTGRNPNVGTYEYYDQLPTAQTNEFDTVEYNWSRFAATVIISGQEEDENRGEAQIFRLMTGKMEALEESIREKFSEYVYGAGAGTDPNGLANLIPDDPTTGTLGTINRATELQWRPSAYDFNGSIDETNIEEAMDDIKLDLTLRGNRPSVILLGRNLYRFLRAAVRDKMVVNLGESGSSGRQMVDLGFEGLRHNAVPVLYDEDCPVNKGYWINDRFIRLHVLRHVNMKVARLSSPWNMDATGRRTLWQGQWAAWRQFRTNAVLINE